MRSQSRAHATSACHPQLQPKTPLFAATMPPSLRQTDTSFEGVANLVTALPTYDTLHHSRADERLQLFLPTLPANSSPEIEHRSDCRVACYHAAQRRLGCRKICAGEGCHQNVSEKVWTTHRDWAGRCGRAPLA